MYAGLQIHKNIDRSVTLFGNCVVTGNLYSVTISDIDYNFFINNRNLLIQNALPNLSIDDREFLISGISPAGWVSMFGADEND